jgi:DNA replication protein DnaC
MERVSDNLQDIVGKVAAQRRHQGEHSPTHGAQGQRSQTTSRAPLPEQRANLGRSYAQRNSQYAPKKPQNYKRQNERAAQYEEPPYNRTPSPSMPANQQPVQYARPAYTHMPMAANDAYPQQRSMPTNDAYPQRSVPTNDAYPQRSVPMQYPAYYNEEPRPRADNMYYTDEYGNALRADVLPQWEDETDAVDEMEGIQEGDWETMVAPPRPPYQEARTMPAPRTPLPYQSAEAIISHRRAGYVQATPEVTRIEEVNPGPDNASRRRTRDLRTAMSPMPSALPPTPRTTLPAPRQPGAQAYRPRDTQPLVPSAINSMGREMPARQPYQEQQRPARPVPAVRESSAVAYVPSTPAPTAPKGACPKCSGAGYLRADVPFGHPNFGKPIPCVCKEAERKEKRRQQLRDISNLDAFRDRTFKTFNSRVPGVQEAYEMSYDYAQDPEGWLLLVGPNGCGKTHLAAAIANQCLESGAVVLFAVVPDLLDHLRAAFAPTSTEVFDQLFSKMREAEVLILDDLGAQQSSPWANEKLFQLLNYRYNMGMPTVITANQKGLQGVDERIRSRLTDVSLVASVQFERARDYRPHHPRHDS